jgi:hypothetical protein
MQVEDVEMVRATRREMARHQLDVSMVTVSAHHGVIHLNGEVRPLRGHEPDFEQELHALHKCLRQRQGVRDVIFEWSLPPGYKIVDTSIMRSR